MKNIRPNALIIIRKVEWIPISEIKNGNLILYPEEVIKYL